MTLVYNNPNGVAFFGSGQVQNATKPGDELQSFADHLSKKYPDVKVIQQPQAVQVGGKQGLYAIFSYTLTPQGGQAILVNDLFWVGVNANGTVVYEFEGLAADSVMDTFLSNGLNPLQKTVQWKL